MAWTVTVTPAYQFDLKDKTIGAGGRVTVHTADKANGQLEVSVGTTANPAAGAQTTLTAGIAAVGDLLDVPPGQTLTVEANLNTTLTLLSIQTPDHEGYSSGWSGLIVLELNGNTQQPTGSFIVETNELWNLGVGGSASLNFSRREIIRGAMPITPGNLYLIWAWIGAFVKLEEAPGGANLNQNIAFAGLDADVLSFTATVQ